MIGRKTQVRMIAAIVAHAVFLLVSPRIVMAQTGQPEDAPPLLYLWVSQHFTALTPSGERFASEMSVALTTAGVANSTVDSEVLPQTPAPSVRNILVIDVGDTLASEGARTLVAYLVPIDSWGQFRAGNFSQARSLVIVPIQTEGGAQALEVLITKVIESLRSTALCHILVESDPPGATVSLEGVGYQKASPIEALAWPSTLRLRATAKGYLPHDRAIQMPSPGHYSFLIQLKRQPVFNRKFLIPGVACLGVGVAAFIAEYYYYDKYSSLGLADWETNPGSFESTFKRAKAAELTGKVATALGAVFLTVSFVF